MINIPLRSRTAAVAAPAQAPSQASSDEMLVTRIAVGDKSNRRARARVFTVRHQRHDVLQVTISL